MSVQATSQPELIRRKQAQSPLEAMDLHLLREAVPGAEVCR